MKFECGDLERALAQPELMPEAREHLKDCADCRREYRLWVDISSTAKHLHHDWESPSLWPKIREVLETEHQPAPVWWRQWRIWAVAAGVCVAAVLAPFFWRRALPPAVATVARQAPAPAAAAARTDEDFLTEQALLEVEKSEAAYRQSIEKLSHLAEPKLKSASSARVINEREKLLTLDSAIAETRANVKLNRFNVHLQTALADLYREKQQTLQELLTRDQKN